VQGKNLSHKEWFWLQMSIVPRLRNVTLED
jgi:hypothetical protein